MTGRAANASPRKDPAGPMTKGSPGNRSSECLSSTGSSSAKAPAREIGQKPQTNAERLTSILKRSLQLDSGEHERRAVLLNSASLFISDRELTLEQKTLFVEVLFVVFSTPPPFSVITKSYRQIYFHNRDHASDVTVGYRMLKLLIPLGLRLSIQFLRILMRRMTSASKDDRAGADASVRMLGKHYTPILIHLLALCLVPPPPHGTHALLELASHLLGVYKAPTPLFDDFFVTTSFDDTSDVLSIQGAVSEDRLNDGITIFRELECTFRMLHYAPHYQSFSTQMIAALKALHDHNGEYAHKNRRFLLNQWPRNDPQKAVLFMKEATAIFVHGPPPEEFVWQRLSWRSVSIHWQIAMEGLTFIQQTRHRAEGFDHNVLVYLLDDAVKGHWNHNVRRKAGEVRALLPNDVKPVPPKALPKDMWNKLMEVAVEKYPGSQFSTQGTGRPRRKIKK